MPGGIIRGKRGLWGLSRQHTHTILTHLLETAPVPAGTAVVMIGLEVGAGSTAAGLGKSRAGIPAGTAVAVAGGGVHAGIVTEGPPGEKTAFCQPGVEPVIP
jgi:hypothetical protein